VNESRRPLSAPPAGIRPELHRFIDAAIVPALLERFLREHATTTITAPDFQKADASV
jgi:hypothetical protein